MKNYVGFSFMQDIIHPPFWWIYNASAEIHDQAYKEGGTREDRLKADLGFFWRVLHDANQIDDTWVKIKAVYTAIAYFILVRMFGWIAFNKK